MAKKATKKTAKKAKSLSTQQKVGIGVGLTTAAVAAAGAYFLYGSADAKKNRQKVKSWTLKAKAEVLETLEKAHEMTEEEYDKLIDTVSGAYSRLKDASKADIATFKREMKHHWKGIEKVAKPAKKKAAKKAKKATKKAKKATKKTTKKTAKKKTTRKKS
tara:strand:+ start:4882 stop:5361 length:480 start_codon:yes stop_codon:yes gene_type:complete